MIHIKKIYIDNRQIRILATHLKQNPLLKLLKILNKHRTEIFFDWSDSAFKSYVKIMYYYIKIKQGVYLSLW